MSQRVRDYTHTRCDSFSSLKSILTPNRKSYSSMVGYEWCYVIDAKLFKLEAKATVPAG